jgi:hypothetical protein
MINLDAGDKVQMIDKEDYRGDDSQIQITLRSNSCVCLFLYAAYEPRIDIVVVSSTR